MPVTIDTSVTRDIRFKPTEDSPDALTLRMLDGVVQNASVAQTSTGGHTSTSSHASEIIKFIVKYSDDLPELIRILKELKEMKNKP